jgi:hypothetical protein
MPELANQTKTDLNIGAEAEVLSYTYVGAIPIEVMARVDLGDTGQPIAGDGNYLLNFYVNSVLITPVSIVNVPTGVTRTTMVSRAVPLRQNDLVSIRIVGRPFDVSVDTVTSLRDVSPTKITDVLGFGPIQVDHNYGGPDNLAYQTASGAAIEDATILVFTALDYNMGNIDAGFAIARSMTTQDRGRWNQAVMLNPGQYVIVFTKPEAFGPDARAVIVS